MLKRAQTTHTSASKTPLLAFALLLSTIFLGSHQSSAQSVILPLAPAAQSQPARLSAEDEAFLEDLSRRAFLYFKEHADPSTGLVLDRARASGEAHPAGHPSHDITSSAATGFGLTALCIGAERGWISRAEARARVVATLRFYAERAPHKNGWFLHWMDKTTGERRWRSEYSSIDTALLLGGILAARGYFRTDAEVVRLATSIYERVDFGWMLANHPTLLSHGWRPETGFLKTRWDTYSEHLILQLLAVGSPTHPIKPHAWRAWSRKRITYAGRTYLNDGPLFTHQYSHAWVDFRGRVRAVPSRTLREIRVAANARTGISASVWRATSQAIRRMCGASRLRTARRVMWHGAGLRATPRLMGRSCRARRAAL